MNVAATRAMVFATLAGLVSVDYARGEEKLLQWKFEKGQTLNVEITQSSHTETTVGDKTLTMDLAWVMEMNWTVNDVHQDGSANMTQSFTRMKIQMTAPQVGTIEFDSAADEGPADHAEVIGGRLEPLIGVEFTVRMNNRGGIEDVQFPEQLIKQLEETQPSNLKGILNREGIEKILRQSIAVLPEAAVDTGDNWTVVIDTPSPIGLLRQSHKYTYEGTETRDGKPLEKITVDSDIEIVPSNDTASSKTELKKQQQTGVLYFDAQAGRFVESSVTQELRSETPFRDLKIHVKVDSSMQMRIRPSAR